MGSPLDRSFNRLMRAMPAEDVSAVAVSNVAGGSNVAEKKKTISVGIKRDNDYMYFIKEGAVWRVPRKKPGKVAKGKKEKLAQFCAPSEMNYSKYLYYLDGKGNVVLTPRGGKKKSKKKK
jgi:hypothetical protein